MRKNLIYNIFIKEKYYNFFQNISSQKKFKILIFLQRFEAFSNDYNKKLQQQKNVKLLEKNI